MKVYCYLILLLIPFIFKDLVIALLYIIAFILTKEYAQFTTYPGVCICNLNYNSASIVNRMWMKQ